MRLNSFILVFALLLPMWDSQAETGIIEQQISVPQMCLIHEDICRDDGKFSSEVTFYTSDSAETDSTPSVTASQKRTRFGVVACPDALSFGTKVLIGNHVYTCEDRKNMRYRMRDGISGRYYFDVWLASKSRAMRMGRRAALVQIVSISSSPGSS